LLQGQIPPGTPRNISDDCITEPIKKNVIHCVCFVIPIGFVLEDDDVKTHVRGTMEKVIALGYQPMIVVTRIDEIEQIELREELQDRLIAMVPASPNNILFHQNYHSENIRVNSIDLSSRKILNTMKSLALTQIKILGGKNFLTSFDQNIETVFTLQQKIIIDGSGKKFLEGEFNENKIKETEKIKENKIKETELSIWLESLKISEEIISNFSDLGATEINDILDLEEEDWTNVKVSPFIQKKILKNLPNGNTKTTSENFKNFLINKIELEENIAEGLIRYGIATKEDLSEIEDKDLESIGMDKPFTRTKTLKKKRLSKTFKKCNQYFK